MLKRRLDHLRSFLEKQNIDSCLISSSNHLSYLTGYFGFSEIEREGFLFVTKTSAILLTSPLHIAAVTQTVKHLSVLNLSTENNLGEHLLKLLENKDTAKIGFEAENLSVSEFILLKKTKLIFTAISLRNLRLIKQVQEIENIKKASQIAKNSLKKIMKSIVPGVTEKKVALLLENEIRNQGADIAFPTIVAFGQNSATPHHLTDNTKLRKNDVVLIDFGAKWKGYCSDCTRTFFIGEVPKAWRKIHKTVEASQQKALEYLKNELGSMNYEPMTNDQGLMTDARSIKASKVDGVARDHINSQGYPTIPHSLGHGIGLAVHESPSLSPKSQDTLKEGMIFSIEPGIYIAGEMGVRIEDLFTIQNNKLLKLT